MLAVGPTAGAIGILVGESPGLDEQKESQPFVGPTGQELDRELTKVGLPRERLRIVNAIACLPPLSAKSEGNMRRAVDCCKPLFLAQVIGCPDVPILAMGKWAFYALTGKDRGVMSNRGFIQNFKVSR